MLGQYSERDQYGGQHGERRQFVEQPRGEKEVVFEYAVHADAVADDVAQELEEREDLEHQHEAGQQYYEIEHEAGKHIGIGDAGQQRKTSEPGSRLQALERPAQQRKSTETTQARTYRSHQIEVAGFLQTREHRNA